MTYSRIRNRTFPRYSPGGRLWHSAGPVTYGDEGNPWLRSNLSEITEDNITPGYFASSRRGLNLPVNPFRNRKWSIVTDGDSYWSQRYENKIIPSSWHETRYWGNLSHAAVYSAKGGGTNHPDALGFGGTVPSWPSKSEVLQAAMAKANSARFDALTFAAEFSKTLDLARLFGRNSLRRALTILSVMERRYRRSERTHRLFSEMWLEARYGWRLVVYDALALSEAWARLRGFESLRSRFSSYASNEAVGLDQTGTHKVRSGSPWTTLSTSGTLNVSWSFRQEMKRTVRAGVAVTHVYSDAVSVDPLVTAYELVPYSFVVDWFTTLGQAVKAHSPFANTNLQWAYATLEYEYVRRWSASLVRDSAGYPSGTWNYFTSGTHHETTLTYRDKTRSPETPTVHLGFDLNFDYAKLTDLVSLAAKLWNVRRGLKP